jgi:hypothetical protein
MGGGVTVDREQIRRYAHYAERHKITYDDGRQTGTWDVGPTLRALLDELERADQHLADRARVTALIDALKLARRALLRHGQWCGYRPEAPGDPSFNDAIRASEEALAPWEAE